MYGGVGDDYQEMRNTQKQNSQLSTDNDYLRNQLNNLKSNIQSKIRSEQTELSLCYKKDKAYHEGKVDAFKVVLEFLEEG